MLINRPTYQTFWLIDLNANTGSCNYLRSSASLALLQVLHHLLASFEVTGGYTEMSLCADKDRSQSIRR